MVHRRPATFLGGIHFYQGYFKHFLWQLPFYFNIYYRWLKIIIVLYKIKYINLQQYNFIHQPHYFLFFSIWLIFPLAFLEAQFYSNFSKLLIHQIMLSFYINFWKYIDFCIDSFFFQLSNNALALSSGPHFIWWWITCNFHLIMCHFYMPLLRFSYLWFSIVGLQCAWISFSLYLSYFRIFELPKSVSLHLLHIWN